eukprot:scaffold11656_cov85-Skeletonema_dohrnii-CCMP3373.AAC.9
MKKLMSGLRRNRNSIGSSSSTDNVDSSDDGNNMQQEKLTDDDVNYADLFDDDDDENSKENNLNNNTQRHKNRKSTSTTKKRKKLHNSQKLAAVTSSMKVMPMMTISEMVECEEDEESIEDESEGEGVNSNDVTVVEEEDDDIYLLDEDEETTNEESNEEDAVALSEDIMEDGEALPANNAVSEEFQTGDENKVDSTITSQVNVVEEEQDAIDVDDKEEVTSSIGKDIRRSSNCSEEEAVSSIDGQFEGNNNGNEEVINQEAVNSHEAVTPQVSHDNVTQLRHHHVKEEDNRDCLSSMGLYTPSSFMQSLRIKYQVGLEGHA